MFLCWPLTLSVVLHADRCGLLFFINVSSSSCFSCAPRHNKCYACKFEQDLCRNRCTVSDQKFFESCYSTISSVVDKVQNTISEVHLKQSTKVNEAHYTMLIVGLTEIFRIRKLGAIFISADLQS